MKPILVFALFATVCIAQDTPQDAEGCTDSPLVARFPGSHINSCEHKEFQAADIPVSRDKDGNSVAKSIEGDYYYYDIGTRDGLKLRVEGHTDNAGTRATNQKLSEQRAAAVVSWLAAHGIDRSRLAAQGFADTKPVADNSSEEGRAKNRRVELVKM